MIDKQKKPQHSVVLQNEFVIQEFHNSLSDFDIETPEGRGGGCLLWGWISPPAVLGNSTITVEVDLPETRRGRLGRRAPEAPPSNHPSIVGKGMEARSAPLSSINHEKTKRSGGAPRATGDAKHPIYHQSIMRGGRGLEARRGRRETRSVPSITNQS